MWVAHGFPCPLTAAGDGGYDAHGGTHTGKPCGTSSKDPAAEGLAKTLNNVCERTCAPGR